MDKKINDFIKYDFKGLSNLLNKLSPFEFGAIGSAIGLLISLMLTNNEQNTIGNLFELIGQVILTVQAQGSNQQPNYATENDVKEINEKINFILNQLKNRNN